jgi:hypothetical protein
MVIFQAACRTWHFRQAAYSKTARDFMMSPTKWPLLARYWGEEQGRVCVPVILSVVFFQAVLRKEFVGPTFDKFFR